MRKSVLTMGLVVLACVSLWGCKGNSLNKSASSSNTSASVSDVESVRDIIKRAYDNSLYSRFTLDDSLDLSVMFDTNGRAYVESDYVNGFYIDKNKSLIASYDSSNKPYWEVINEYTPLYFVEKALVFVDNGKGSISKYDGEEGDTVYQIDIKGSNIREFFSELGEQVSNDYCQFLFNRPSNELTDLDMINIYVMNKPDNLPIFKADVQTSDGVMTIWNLEGLLEVGGITFDDSIANIKNGDDFDEVNKKLDLEKEKMGEALTGYIESHPELKEKLELNSIDTSEINDETVTEETVTEETSESLENKE